MREVRLIITCDWCKEEIAEQQTRTVKLTFGTRDYEGEACQMCSDSLLQEMRPVTKKRTRRKSTTT